MSLMHHADPQFVNEPIITLAWIPDEYGAQLMQADFSSWSLVAYQHSRSEPILFLEDQDIADVLVDTPIAWDVNARGYTFRHDLLYGADYDGQLFVPAVGHPVRLEYTLYRTNDANDNPRGPRCIGKLQPIRDWLSARVP